MRCELDISIVDRLNSLLEPQKLATTELMTSHLYTSYNKHVSLVSTVGEIIILSPNNQFELNMFLSCNNHRRHFHFKRFPTLEYATNNLLAFLSVKTSWDIERGKFDPLIYT